MMKYLSACFILLALLSWIAGYTLGPFFQDGFWFTCDAIGKLFIAAAVTNLSRNPYEQTLARAFVALAASNLLDELFFDPTVTGWNEWLFGCAVLTYVSYRFGYARHKQ